VMRRCAVAGPADKSNKIAGTSRVVSGGFVALLLALLVSALSLFGIVSVTLGHIYICLAWVVGVLLISTEVMPGRPARHKVWSIAILGVVVLAIDIGILKLKAMTGRTEHAISQSATPNVSLMGANPAPAQGKASQMIGDSEINKVAVNRVTIAPSAKPVRPVVLNDSSGSAVSISHQGGTSAGTVDVGGVTRHIRREDEVSLIAWLSQKPSKITLAVKQGDVEAKMYAEEWKAVLGKSGWRVTGIQSAATDRAYGINVNMYGDSASRPGKFEVFPDEPAYFLVHAFELEGIALIGHRDPKQGRGTLRLFIGTNPSN
jgi:hypothetical protein